MSASPVELTRDALELRPRLVRLAYQLVGSAPEAEDIVQEALLRWHQFDAEPIRQPWSWLATVVSRIGLDHLRSGRYRRERSAGIQLPVPPVRLEFDPAEQVILDEAVTTAFLIVLESLTPPQRVVFVLHEVFQWPFPAIAEVIGRTPQACRQLAARARSRVREHHAPQRPVDEGEHRAVVLAFQDACTRGDLAALLRLLDEAVVVRTDGGSFTSARRPIQGADRAATYVSRILAKWPVELRTAVVGGAPGIVAWCGGKVVAVASVVVHNGTVRNLDILADPTTLAHVPGAMTAEERLAYARSRRPKHGNELSGPDRGPMAGARRGS